MLEGMEVEVGTKVTLASDLASEAEGATAAVSAWSEEGATREAAVSSGAGEGATAAVSPGSAREACVCLN